MHSFRNSFRYFLSGMLTPLSPWIGSTITAQVLDVMVFFIAAISSNGTYLNPWQKRTEPFLDFILWSRAHRSQCSPVERFIGGDELGSAFLSPVDIKPPCEFDGAFVGLGSAVAEKNFCYRNSTG